MPGVHGRWAGSPEGIKRWLMILLATFAGSAKAAEIIQVTWPTKHASPPLRLEPKVMAWMPAFRMALGSVPEATTVNLALTQPALLGLTVEQAQQPQPLVAEQYRQMAASAVYQKAPRLLVNCLREKPPPPGLAPGSGGPPLQQRGPHGRGP